MDFFVPLNLNLYMRYIYWDRYLDKCSSQCIFSCRCRLQQNHVWPGTYSVKISESKQKVNLQFCHSWEVIRMVNVVVFPNHVFQHWHILTPWNWVMLYSLTLLLSLKLARSFVQASAEHVGRAHDATRCNLKDHHTHSRENVGLNCRCSTIKVKSKGAQATSKTWGFGWDESSSSKSKLRVATAEMTIITTYHCCQAMLKTQELWSLSARAV